MRSKFHDDVFINPMADLVSLKQTTIVKKFYEEFETQLNLLHLSEGYALSIFVINLKSKISKSVKLFHPKILTHALNLVKKWNTSFIMLSKSLLYLTIDILSLVIPLPIHNLLPSHIALLIQKPYQAYYLHHKPV